MSSTTPFSLPPSCRAIIFHGADKSLTVENIPTPSPVPGTVIVRVLASTIEASIRNIFAGKIPGLKMPPNTTPGGRSIGRIAATGPDTTSLTVGQLVMLDPFIRARDNPDIQILWGLSEGMSPASQTLFQANGILGMWTEYTRAPLENVFPLNEARLLGAPADGGLGYKIADLTYIARALVGYGGLRGINLQAGETIVIAPATGGYSSAAVQVASAMGARVIAVGRNLAALQAVARTSPRVEVVQLKGDVEEDFAALQKFGTIDAYLDLSPPSASASTHVRSCFKALKWYGRVSLMGVLGGDIAVPYVSAVYKNLTIKGQYMYEPEDARGIVKMVENGLLRLGESAGHEVCEEFGLEDWEKALEVAVETTETNKWVVLTP